MARALPEPAAFVLDRPGPDEVWAALADRAGVVRDRADTTERTVLDTFDGLLRAAGLTLEGWRAGPGRLAFVLTGPGCDLRTDPLAMRPPRRLWAGDLPAGPVRDRVAAAVGVRALLPQARIRSRREPARVQDRRGKTVVRLVLERPSVVVAPGGGDGVALAPRLEVRPVLGYADEFARACRTVAALPGLSVPAAPLADEAMAAAGGAPGGTPSSVDVELRPGMRADEATVRLCRALARVVEANLPGTLADVDTEFLHDLRVAVRRTRSLLREMKGVLPAAGTARAAVDLRWVQEVTGPTRDLDVHLLGWPGTLAALPDRAAHDLAPLHGLLQRRRAAAFARMRRTLRGARFGEAWAAWTAFVDEAAAGGDRADAPNAARAVEAVAGERVVAVYRRMYRMGREIGDGSPPTSLHDLRKRGKELRYLLELYGRLWPADAVRPLVAQLKRLQDVLGRFQDDEIQAGYLRSLAPELVHERAGTDAVIALGLVIDHLARDQQQARDAFAERFAAFTPPSIRELVGTTFGGRR